MLFASNDGDKSSVIDSIKKALNSLNLGSSIWTFLIEQAVTSIVGQVLFFKIFKIVTRPLFGQ